MTIKIGESIPNGKLGLMTAAGPGGQSTAELFGNKRVALFAVPGAFTPTCHQTHMPSIVEAARKLSEKGLDAIYCLSVNDVFVMAAWDEATGASKAGVTLLADGAAEWTRALGLELDLTGYGMGLRSQRFAMVVDHGKVTHLEIESNPGLATCSRGDHLLSLL
jgi:peroxiredoxin